MKKLKEVAIVRTGYTFRARLEPKATGTIAVLQPRDIADGMLTSNPTLISSDLINSLQNYLLKSGEVLIANKGLKFASFLYEGEPELSVASSSFFVITVNDSSLLPYFLHWYLNQNEVKEYLQNNLIGATVPTYNKTVLENLPVQIPPLAVQKEAIELLKTTAKERLLLRQLINKREDLSTAFIWDQINRTKADEKATAQKS